MIANLSLDLDNKWSYLKTAGVEDWSTYPTYLPLVSERICRILADNELKITVFVVGRDLDQDANRTAVAQLAHAGHSLANHSMEHHSWLGQLSPAEVRTEIVEAHHAITNLTGVAPIGFRGPSYSDSSVIHEILLEHAYQYCASSFPSSVGPMARAFYLLRTGFRTKKENRSQLFGNWSDMFKSNRPYPMKSTGNRLWMFPVTVQPISRLPFHFTYLNFLSEKSLGLARLYFRISLSLCRLFRVPPSLLLHPLDFLGAEEEPQLSFFPGMKLDSRRKLEQLNWFLRYLKNRMEVMPMENHLAQLKRGAESKLSFSAASRAAQS